MKWCIIVVQLPTGIKKPFGPEFLCIIVYLRVAAHRPGYRNVGMVNSRNGRRLDRDRAGTHQMFA